MKCFRGCLTAGPAGLLAGADSPRPEWTTELRKMEIPHRPGAGDGVRGRLRPAAGFRYGEGRQGARQDLPVPARRGQELHRRHLRAGAEVTAGSHQALAARRKIPLSKTPAIVTL